MDMIVCFGSPGILDGSHVEISKLGVEEMRMMNCFGSGNQSPLPRTNPDDALGQGSASKHCP